MWRRFLDTRKENNEHYTKEEVSELNTQAENLEKRFRDSTAMDLANEFLRCAQNNNSDIEKNDRSACERNAAETALKRYVAAPTSYRDLSDNECKWRVKLSTFSSDVENACGVKEPYALDTGARAAQLFRDPNYVMQEAKRLVAEGGRDKGSGRTVS